MLGAGVNAILTASPTPTLAVYPLAAGRDVLVLHAGLATERFPATSRSLFQLRPSAAARADVLAAHAWERGIRRLGVLGDSDSFGRAVRAAVAARWRQQGGHLAHDESVSLDASDLRSRLRAVARVAPEAVVLGFQGTALGEAARALRDAGYAGQILATDDDRAALLAGGRALDGALILADAFVPLPGTRGARFARAYEARHGQPPVPLRGERVRDGDAPRRGRSALASAMDAASPAPGSVTSSSPGAAFPPSTRASWWSATTARSRGRWPCSGSSARA